MEDDGMFPIRKPADEEGYALEVERDRHRFLVGRKGDHLTVHFQCELCHFRNLQLREPQLTNLKDQLLMKFIRRANLDSFWSREPSTIAANWNSGIKMVNQAETLGLNMDRNLPPMGPSPLSDKVGMFLAVQMLKRSQDAGKNEATVQYDTVRKLRSFYFNIWQASVNGLQAEMVAVRKTQRLVVTTSPSSMNWFEQFALGMHKRMGDLHFPDLAVSIEVMLELMKRFEQRWLDQQHVRRSEASKEGIIFPALFAILAYMGGLRGEEVMLCDLGGMRKHHNAGVSHRVVEKRHTTIALVGRFKTEVGEKYHLMPIVLQSASGLKPKAWVERMLEWYHVQGIRNGPVFRTTAGKRAHLGMYQGAVMEVLSEIQNDHPEWIPASVDVYEEYGMGRSWRRGSNTQAINQKVDARDIDLNNRWRLFENAGGRTPRLQMQQHYAEVLQLLPSLLRYSKAL